MNLGSFEDLFIEQLRDLYSAETQILKALPKMIKGANAPELQRAFEEHLDETQAHAERLEQILKQLGARTRGKKCKAMEGLLEEGAEILKAKADDPAVRDAALIAAAQRVEHYEIAGYGCARTFAHHLSDEMAASLLEQTLQEEMAADQKLSQIAETSINRQAAVATL
jgi:ferritin-like metal-binding protein YciE